MKKDPNLTALEAQLAEARAKIRELEDGHKDNMRLILEAIGLLNELGDFKKTQIETNLTAHHAIQAMQNLLMKWAGHSLMS